MRNALLFDCDGVLVDAEHLGHLRAFNEMWRQFGVPWRWTVEEYGRKLAISGGRERLLSLRHDAAFRSACAVPEDPVAWQALVDAWQRRKTELYVGLVSRNLVPPRSGTRRLAVEARRAGWGLAVVSAGSAASVRAVLDVVFGDDIRRELTLVTGESEVRKKPAPDSYLAAAAALGVDPADCVVIEDSAPGLTAARAAGAACVVTPTRMTAGQDFGGASLVVSEIGDPSGPPVSVLANPLDVTVNHCLRLGDLSRLLRARRESTAHQPIGT